MITIKNLLKKYDDRMVLNISALSINDKTLTSIIGPNGSGKSTLLSILSRSIEPNFGTINLDGNKINEYTKSEYATILSMLYQSNNFDLDITVEELVEFGRYPYTKGNITKKDKDIINESIKLVEMEHLKNKYINELSGGEKQRALLAMLLAQDTKYILLDEPLNNLDMKSAKKLMIILRDLVDNYNKTIILVVHDINFASLYSDDIIGIKDGKILMHGNVKETITSANLEKLYGIQITTIKNNNVILCNYFK